MNTGIQDVHNLVWKLADVLAGRAKDALLDTYETERRPVAENNSQASLENAAKMFDVLEPAAAYAESPDPESRARLVRVIDEQAGHFDMLGMQLGFAYEEGALLPDGTELHRPADPVREFLPSARPGCRLPHVWICKDDELCSTLDLVPYDGLTVIAGRDGGAWQDAADSATVRCLHSGRDFDDPDAGFEATCGIMPGGALVVRPDQIVAARFRTAPDVPLDALRSALSAAA